MNAIDKFLLNLEIKGCFCTIFPATYGNIFSRQVYNNVSLMINKFSLYSRMLVALSFIPVNRVVIEYFEILCNQVHEIHLRACDDVLVSLQDAYIRSFRQNASSHPPSFVTEIRNMFQRTFDELPRTNNSIDEYH